MSGGVTIERVDALPEGLDVLVRESLREDFRAIDGLQRAWEAGDNRFERPGEALFSARVGGLLGGLCGLNIDPYLDDPGTGRLRHLYVLPGLRRTGLGRALVSQVLHHAQGRFDRVRLRTPQRQDATRFYDALGFARTPAERESTHAMAPPFFIARHRPMAPALHDFLVGRTPDCVEPLRWGPHALQLRAYLTADRPPAEFLLAGRAIVRREDQVLLCENPGGKHILPGGRIEPGEDGADAARREVLEETGWDVEVTRPLGLLHLYYETPAPTGVGRVIYPDFLWQVFEARALRHRPEAMIADDYEFGGAFRPLAEARPALRHGMERLLLSATER